MKGFIAVKEGFITNMCKKSKRVLHIGCTNSPNCIRRWDNGSLLHKKIINDVESSGGTVVGIDLDGDAIGWLKNKMPAADLRVVDACYLQEHFSEEFDLIIAGDVIEHLPNPGLFLEACANVLSDQGKLVITTSNTFSIIRFAKALLFHEAVHDEHTAYYSHKTLSRLLAMSNLKPVAFGYYRSEPLSYAFSVNRIISNALEYLACIIWHQLAEGVIVCAEIEGRYKN